MANALKMTWFPLCRALGIALAVLLCGCSSSPETTAVSRQGLTFPVRITIATPNPVSPTAPAMVASNSVRLGGGAEIVSGMVVAMGSGGLWADPDATLNESWSRGVATLRDRVRIRAKLHARTRVDGSGVSVSSWDQNPAFDPPQVLSWEVIYPSGAAANYTLNDAMTGSIAPGRWGTVTINSQAVLTLQTGTYYLTSLNLQSGSTIKLDQARGPVVIYVTDTLAFRGAVVPLVGSDRRLLMAYLGTNPIFIDTQFDGALVAPSTTLTLRSVAGAHSGYFFAKDVVLDAGARAKFGTALALISVAAPGGAKCREWLGSSVPEKDILSICGGCGVRVDTDRDGVDDCVDECAFDSLKTKAGQCGCGVPETDTDGDGVPNCLDDCDLDPNNVTSGQCGCLSSNPNVLKPQPAGTKCTDSACSQPSATCNSSGVCGNRSTCPPATSNCRLVQYDRSSYWICQGPVTQSAASLACRNKQMTLVRIDGFSENAFLASFAGAPLWTGANSISSSGAWRWSSSTGNDGDPFWSGAANGTQQNSLFSKWASSTPAVQRCAVIQADGRWADVDCSQGLGFICEYSAPLAPGPVMPLPGAPAQPPAMNCAQSGPALPAETDAGFAELTQAVINADASPPVYQGAAANPPAPNSVSTCPNIDGANGIGAGEMPDGCTFQRAANETPGYNCFVDSDCAQFGTGLLCRQIKDDSACVPILPVVCAPNDISCVPVEGHGCVGHAHCGTLNCPASATICQQYDICPPGTEFTPTTAGSDLAPAQFKPADLFPGQTLPPATPAAVYVDPPTGQGKNHSWCVMSPQQAIPNAAQGNSPKQGKAGAGSPITFSFDPDLSFDANVNPLAMGETDLNVHARAALTTKIGLAGFLGLPPLDFEVLSAVADIEAKRCSISNSATHFKVFGHDFVDLIGVPKFDTSTLAVTKDCNRAVGEFVVAANRAKKAFRDAQQLLTQYKAANGNLRNLCPKLMSLLGANANVPYFPDGLSCPENEPVEITINRFIDYYQAPGVGEISRLREAASKLSAATNALKLDWNKVMKFGPKPKGESTTIVSAQFMIGPVPVMLQVDAFYTYGVAGYFEMGLNFPYDPFSDRAVSDERIAFVRAGVMPYANAGLSAFVGAGRRLGPISASVGVEGVVTLGDVKAPIFAGAGVGATVTKDTRPLPADLALLADASGFGAYTHFGLPKAVKFFVWYNYGAALEVTDVLRGELNGKVRIKFAFFSRTWRKRIVKFNGLSPIRVDLVSGKFGTDPGVSTNQSTIDYPTTGTNGATATTKTVEGTSPVGYSEAQVPLLMLKPLSLDQIQDPSAGTPDGGMSGPGVEFDPTQVGSMFYDDLCCTKATDPVPASNRQCVLPDERPGPNDPPACCGGLECQTITGGGTRCLQPAGTCTPTGEACTADAQCCLLDGHPNDAQGRCVASTCTTCIVPVGDGYSLPCEADADCCGGDAVPQQAYCGYGSCHPGSGS